MPLYQEPQEKKEYYTLEGNGTLTLTDEQRRARSLTILVEKIAKGNPVEYFNFRLPEPRTFWGYLQLVARDYVRLDVALEYRRQVVLARSDLGSQQNALQNCLIIQSQRLSYERLLDLLAIGGVTQQDREILLTEWKTVVPTPALREEWIDTAVWYEIESGFQAKLTIIWIPFAPDCDALTPLKIIGAPRGTEKDEERPAPGGGGQQPSSPPPPGRTSDPKSDNQTPPPNNGQPPPSPKAGPLIANTRVVIVFPEFWDNTSTPCTKGLSSRKSTIVPGIHPASDFAIRDRPTTGLPAPRCANTKGYFSVIATFKGNDLAGMDGGPVEYGTYPYLEVSYV